MAPRSRGNPFLAISKLARSMNVDCDENAPARRSRPDQAAKLRKITEALVPPKPKEFDSATFTSR